MTDKGREEKLLDQLNLTVRPNKINIYIYLFFSNGDWKFIAEDKIRNERGTKKKGYTKNRYGMDDRNRLSNFQKVRSATKFREDAETSDETLYCKQNVHK